MSISEKLGLSPEIKRSIDNSGMPVCEQTYDVKLCDAAPEMLEALIDLARRKEYEAYNAYMDNGWGDESEKKAAAEIKPYTDIIENATGLEWEKVKEL